MFKLCILWLALIAGCLTFSDFEGKVQVILDDEGNDFYLVPVDLLYHVRHKRATNVSTGGNANSNWITVSKDIHDTPNHNVQGTLHSQVNDKGKGLTSGTIDYTYKPSDSKFSLTKTNQGVSLGGNHDIINNDNYKLSATAFANKPNGGDWTRGAGVELSHKPSDSSLSFNAQRSPGAKTTFESTGTYNVFRSADGRGTVGLYGNYGGGGGGARSCGGGLKASYRF
ncbi:PREDICTED: uncharacterized protein LOC108567285 [Nicrophorus vespilloides]|uniref:Uncharacterized protein LOC108567285 n=1 Tax=Nicrophorus vespilloides TaxID=110193 RepID=A0ABM1N8J2_NICVS|nr:PREDICTED: uncharacterized protein LOC108567285 [Nicrophorus vespilloides]